jgi:energy-coupling factor transporter ATP-binding protein EcfA2
LAGVRTLIANATQGKGGGALFVGPHGAGKSRMLEGIAGIASLEGHLTARTAAHPVGENLWCRVIEAVCQALLADSESPPPQGADALAALCELPEVEEDLEELAIPFLERDPPLDDRLLFQLFQSYLKKSKDKSIVILIDDLEWLQPNEADVLEKLLQRCKSSSITIVGATTEGAPLAIAGMRTIPLSPLSARNLHKLAELQVRGAVPKTVRQLLEVTQGLPGNVALVLKVLVQAGALVKVNNEWLVFPSAAETTTVPLIEEYVANHIAALQQGAADFLRAVAERSRPTPRATVETHQDRTRIDELLELGLLKEEADHSGIAVAGAVVLQHLYRGDDVEM